MKPRSGSVTGRMILLGFLALHGVVVGLFVLLWLENRDPATPAAGDSTAGAPRVLRSLFTLDYPRNGKFREELKLLRRQKRLDPDNETLIDQTVRIAAADVGAPPALVWCLLFQESRLDHLLGLHDDRGAKGLGQFSYFSFQEINTQLSRYTPDNLRMLLRVLNLDPRPITPRRESLLSPASYFYIPTAVSASTAYLNNRFHQLRRVLERRDVPHHPDVLWLHAAMAYNKGTRTVLSFWNQIYDQGGHAELSGVTTDPRRFFAATGQSRRLTRALSRIWPRPTAERYGAELERHLDRIRACSVEEEARAI